MYITQIKPLENVIYESVLKFPRPPISKSKNASYPKKPELFSEPLSKRDFRDVFHVDHTNFGVMRSFSMCITQSKPLVNGDYYSVLKYPLQHQIMRVTQKNCEVCSEQQTKRGYEDVFHVYNTNQTLGKR